MHCCFAVHIRGGFIWWTRGQNGQKKCDLPDVGCIYRAKHPIIQNTQQAGRNDWKEKLFQEKMSPTDDENRAMRRRGEEEKTWKEEKNMSAAMVSTHPPTHRVSKISPFCPSGPQQQLPVAGASDPQQAAGVRVYSQQLRR